MAGDGERMWDRTNRYIHTSFLLELSGTSILAEKFRQPSMYVQNNGYVAAGGHEGRATTNLISPGHQIELWSVNLPAQHLWKDLRGSHQAPLENRYSRLRHDKYGFSPPLRLHIYS